MKKHCWAFFFFKGRLWTVDYTSNASVSLAAGLLGGREVNRLWPCRHVCKDWQCWGLTCTCDSYGPRKNLAWQWYFQSAPDTSPLQSPEGIQRDVLPFAPKAQDRSLWMWDGASECVLNVPYRAVLVQKERCGERQERTWTCFCKILFQFLF